MKVLIVASELDPIVKTGGLADVIGALPKELAHRGLDIRIALPDYPVIDAQPLSYVHQPTFSHILTPSGKIDYLVSQVTISGNPNSIFLFKPNRGLKLNEIYPIPPSSEDDRFVIFNLAVADWLKKSDWQPDIVHCHDWMTAALPSILAQKKLAIPTLLTIHNLMYQGQISTRIFQDLGIDHEGLGTHINLLMLGIKTATKINTVSPTYAQESLTPEYGCGLETVLKKRLDDYTGILNGIDYSRYDPQTSSHIRYNYSVYDYAEVKILNKEQLQKDLGLSRDISRPLYGMVSRLEEQKGLEVLDAVLRSTPLLDHAQVVILGVGDKYSERRLSSLTEQHEGALAVVTRYDAKLADRIYASSDFFLMPSRFEPCGLSQLIAMRYGTVPVARRTGGLKDTIIDIREDEEAGTGILFNEYSAREFSLALGASVGLYHNKRQLNTVIQKIMKQDFSWQKSADRYIDLYQAMSRNS